MHEKKMIAPIVITVIFVAYFAAFVAVCLAVPVPLWGKLLFGIVPLALAGVSIYVLIERINEIRSGEDDDLDNY